MYPLCVAGKPTNADWALQLSAPLFSAFGGQVKIDAGDMYRDLAVFALLGANRELVRAL